MTSDDSVGFGELVARSPDTGMISVSRRFEFDPLAAIDALKPGSTGVVAEDDTGRLIGGALVTRKQLSYGGQERPTAYLSNLVVHPDYRRRGVASQLAAWRLEHVRSTLGADATVFAFIQRSNTGSFSTAKGWATQQLGPARIIAQSPRRKPPPAGDYTVRSLGTEDVEEVTEGLDSFYRDFQLFPRQSTEKFAAWLTSTPLESPLHHYHLATDRSGRIVAGAAATELGRLAIDHINRMPAAIRAANAVLKIVPKSGLLTTLLVHRFWFSPGRLAAARFLWETLRHSYRDRNNVIRIELDRRNPLNDAIDLPFYWPSTEISAVTRSSPPLSEDLPIYAEM